MFQGEIDFVDQIEVSAPLSSLQQFFVWEEVNNCTACVNVWVSGGGLGLAPGQTQWRPRQIFLSAMLETEELLSDVSGEASSVSLNVVAARWVTRSLHTPR